MLLSQPLCNKGERFSHHHLIPFEELPMALYRELLYQHFQAGTVTACTNIIEAAQIFPFQPALPRKAVYTACIHLAPHHSWISSQLVDVQFAEGYLRLTETVLSRQHCELNFIKKPKQISQPQSSTIAQSEQQTNLIRGLTTELILLALERY